MAIDFPTGPSDGQLYTYQGRSWVYSTADGVWKGSTALGSGESKVVVQTFTSSGTYTPTPGMQYCLIECQAGGGGGGGAASASATHLFSGSGGEGGGYARKRATAAEIGASQTVTIGALGAGASAGSNAGSAGGDTSVGSLCIAKGGLGGNFGNSTIAALGPQGSATGTGDVSTRGSPGHGGIFSTNTSVASFTLGGRGGSSFFGVGGGETSVSGTGKAGLGYGGGGGGGYINGSGNSAGGNGAPGLVIITEYFSTGAATYLNASDTAAGVMEIAVQSEMETGTDVLRAVTPGRQHFHPSAAKGWCLLNGTGTIATLASYNVSSITDNGTGSYTVNWDTDFSSGNYGFAVSNAYSANGTNSIAAVPGTVVAGSIRVLYVEAGAAADTSLVSVIAFGDQ